MTTIEIPTQISDLYCNKFNGYVDNKNKKVTDILKLICFFFFR